MSNIHGLYTNKKTKSSQRRNRNDNHNGDDYDDDDDQDDNDNDDSNNRYVGGIGQRGGGSGLAVQPNPNHQDRSEDGVTRFLGGGRRDEIFNRAVEDSGAADNGGRGVDDREQVRRIITMYRDGFRVDDGPYRRLDDPANADFLRSLAMGRTPRELAEQSEDGSRDIVVGLVDKRNEDYVEPFQSFSGQGLALGTSTSISTNSTAGIEGSNDGIFHPDRLADVNQTTPATDSSSDSPVTSIAVRMMDGSRKVIKIPLNANVQHLATLIVRSSNTPMSSPFMIISGYPPRPVVEVNQSIEQAGLKNAQISIQKA